MPVEPLSETADRADVLVDIVDASNARNGHTVEHRVDNAGACGVRADVASLEHSNVRHRKEVVLAVAVVASWALVVRALAVLHIHGRGGAGAGADMATRSPDRLHSDEVVPAVGVAAAVALPGAAAAVRPVHPAGVAAHGSFR